MPCLLLFKKCTTAASGGWKNSDSARRMRKRCPPSILGISCRPLARSSRYENTSHFLEPLLPRRQRPAGYVLVRARHDCGRVGIGALFEEWADVPPAVAAVKRAVGGV